MQLGFISLTQFKINYTLRWIKANITYLLVGWLVILFFILIARAGYIEQADQNRIIANQEDIKILRIQSLTISHWLQTGAN